MPCDIGFLASSRAKVFVEASSLKTKSDWFRVFEGSKAARVFEDNTENNGRCSMDENLTAGLLSCRLPLGARRDDVH